MSLTLLETDDSYDFVFKIVLVGDVGVGKTCVVQRFKSGNFMERQGNTIGVDFTMKTMDIQGKRVKLQIWDTAGQERFRTITQSYYRSTNGAVIAYDITKRGTFMAVPKWMEDVKKYGGSNIVPLLIETLHLSSPLLLSPPLTCPLISPVFSSLLPYPYLSSSLLPPVLSHLSSSSPVLTTPSSPPLPHPCSSSSPLPLTS
ncbi:ras-related protein Rab-43 isoform 2-T2 [Salvelinus alpinus]|uniref:ras-related protein Rab-43 isoform X2 n=1 Tax=Salvelinus alpinus TaxID=8036 RepID=UPI0039FD378E